MKITLICPSRSRPERFAKMAESALNLAARPDQVWIQLGVDEDDPQRGDYAVYMPHRCTMQVMKAGQSVPALMNELSRAPGDILMAASDDIVFETPDWDDRVRDAFCRVPDRMLVAYTNDGRNRDKCEHFFVSRQWVEAVGWFMWPGFKHFCADEMVARIGKKVGRMLFLRDVITRHEHFKYGLAPKDETYASKRRIDMSAVDNTLMIELQPEIEAAAARVIEAIQHTEAVAA